MVRLQTFKFSSKRSLGLFMVMMPLCISAFQPSLAHAQPALSPAAKKSSLTTEQRAAFDAIMANSRIQGACAMTTNLKMQNATLDDVVARIKPTLQSKDVSIEVRGAKPVHVSFDLKNARVGDILTPIAALAGCKLYVLSSGLLIASPDQLTEAEKLDFQHERTGEWIRNIDVDPHNCWTLTNDATPSPDKQRALDLCAASLEFKLENVTLDDVAAYIKRNLPEQSVPIQIRGAAPIRASFDLQRTKVGSALTPLAALAGCKVYVLNSGLLISPPSLLTKEEKAGFEQNKAGIWENVSGGDFYGNLPLWDDGMKHPGWSPQKEARRMFSQLLAQEATDNSTKPTRAANTTFGKFSPDSQAMLQQMVDWAIEGARTATPSIPSVYLTPSSRVSISATPEAVQISLTGVDSDSKGTKIFMTTFLK